MTQPPKTVDAAAMLALEARTSAAQVGWLPPDENVINITYSLAERDLICSALRLAATAPTPGGDWNAAIEAAAKQVCATLCAIDWPPKDGDALIELLQADLCTLTRPTPTAADTLRTAQADNRPPPVERRAWLANLIANASSVVANCGGNGIPTPYTLQRDDIEMIVEALVGTGEPDTAMRLIASVAWQAGLENWSLERTIKHIEAICTAPEPEDREQPVAWRWHWRAGDEPDSATGQTFAVEYDGFIGTEQGSYVTREGKPGVVLQQVGTKVVHVYGRNRVAPNHPEVDRG